MHKVILASGSPRRKELLSQANIDFCVCPSAYEEQITDSIPSNVVMALAKGKAAWVADRILLPTDDRVVLGADTVVVYDGKILGKPKDMQDARRMLRMLSGHTHQVYTGVCMIRRVKGEQMVHTFFEKTDVHMYEITDAQIDAYIETKEPLDKAGSYGIQGLGGVFVSGISGDYNNVVGLPLAKVWQYLYTIAQE